MAFGSSLFLRSVHLRSVGEHFVVDFDDKCQASVNFGDYDFALESRMMPVKMRAAPMMLRGGMVSFRRRKAIAAAKTGVSKFSAVVRIGERCLAA